MIDKTWVVKIVGGMKVVVCPYCRNISPYPYKVCDKCKKELNEPVEQSDEKKAWW